MSKTTKHGAGRRGPSALSLASSLAALTFLAGVGPATATTSLPTPAATEASVSVEQAVSRALAAGETPAVLVKFRGKADLSAAYGIADRDARATFVYETLRDFSATRQNKTLQTLSSQFSLSQSAHEYTVLWIDNSIAIARLSAPMLNSLQADPNIESVRTQKEIPLPVEPVVEAAPEPNDAVSSLAHIKVPDVWALGHKGAGVVVANIDAGVRYTHEALVGKYRGNLGGGNFQHNFNWYDPYNHSAAPRSSDKHGTHTMGTMVGDGGTATTQIGAAPDAKWAACIGFGAPGAGATDAGLIECGQWTLAPYPTSGTGTPDPTKHVDIVNNSWGDCGRTYDNWYENVIDGWIAAGIVPVFSNGNASNCGYPNNPPLNTVGNPGRSGKVLGIGSTGTTNGLYASHSNKGTTDNPNPGLPNYPDPRGFANLKPNVVAPGVNIRSSGIVNDSTYYNETGTSMSSPTAAGVIALMWSAADCLRGDFATTGTLLMSTAIAVPVATNSPSDGPGNVPNQATGWGEIDALAAVNAAIAHCNTAAPPSASKSFSPITIANGGTSTLTIVLGNNNATEATLTAALTDTLPANLVVAATPAASTTCTGGTLTAAAGSGSVSLSAGAKIPDLSHSGACTITVPVTSTVNGSYENVIAAGALQTDLANSTAETRATLTVNASGLNPPAVSKEFAPANVSAGAVSTLTITLFNSNPGAALTLTGDLTDTFPSGLVVAAAPNASTTCGGAVTAAAGSGSVTLAASGSTIPAADDCTIKVDVTAANGGSYPNTIPVGALQTNAGANDQAGSATLTVAAGGGLVCSNPINHTIATDLDGSYFGWVSGQVSDDSFTGWNFNPYGTGGNFSFYWGGSSTGNAGVSATSEQTDWRVLQNGDVVGPSSTFSSAIGRATNWNATVNGYLGFKFNCTAGTCYGYAHLNATGSTGFPATLIDYCYDSSGAPITVVGGGGGTPTIAVTPSPLAITVDAGATQSSPLTVKNTGGGTLTYSISEAAAARPVVRPARKEKLEQREFARSSRQLSISRPLTPPVEFGDLTISQMQDNTPVAQSGISCPGAPTSWWRRFYFSEHPAVGANANVQSVTISSETSSGATVPLTINLYTLAHSTAVDTIPTAALTLIGTANGTISGELTTITVPVTGTIDDTVGKDLVVEWHTDNPDAVNFFPGANATPETHPTFLSAETCGNAEPAPASEVGPGFPDFHLVMVVTLGEGGGPVGCENPSDVPWLSVSPASGSLAGGASADSTVTVNAATLAAGSYSANVCVTSNDTVNPLVSVPVNVTVSPVTVPPCSASDKIFCDGFEIVDTSNPNVHDSGVINLDIPDTFDGVYLNWPDGSHCTDGACGGNINAYSVGGPGGQQDPLDLHFFWPNAAGGNEGGVGSAANSRYTILASGATVGPSSEFITAAGDPPADMSNWMAGADGYLGFKFDCTGPASGVCYGYAHLTTTAPHGFPATVVRYWYDTSGAAITIP